jgi:hypothetical protein
VGDACCGYHASVFGETPLRFARRTIRIDDANRLATPRLKFVLDAPGLRTVRPHAQEQPIAIAQKSILSGLVWLDGFACSGGQSAHGSILLVGLGRVSRDLGGVRSDFANLIRS